MNTQSTLSYKGYVATIGISIEDSLIVGKIECINDLITFCAESPSDIQGAFEHAVDDYLKTCEKLGRDPNKVMSGTFNVRIGSSRHKKLFIESTRIGSSINELIKNSIDYYFSEKKEIHNNYFLHGTDLSKGSTNIINVPNWKMPEDAGFSVAKH